MTEQISGRPLGAAEDIGDMQDQQMNERLLQHIREARLQSPKDISAQT
jgi:hypothetical protein